jgi:hypothetical protein
MLNVMSKDTTVDLGSEILHLVWVGNTPPLQVALNLYRLMRAFEPDVEKYSTIESDKRPYMPLLWMDSGSLDMLSERSSVPMCKVSHTDVSTALGNIARMQLREDADKLQWIRISIGDNFQYIPVLQYEDMISSLRSIPGCRDAIDIFHHMIGRIREHNMPPCFVSDLIRLSALAKFGGGYIDVGDIANDMKVLPTRSIIFPSHSELRLCVRRIGSAKLGAIENDVIFCSKAQMQRMLPRIATSAGLKNKLSIYAFGIPNLLNSATLARVFYARQDRYDAPDIVCARIDRDLAQTRRNYPNLAISAPEWAAIFGDDSNAAIRYFAITLEKHISIRSDLAITTSQNYIIPTESLDWLGCFFPFQKEVKRIVMESSYGGFGPWDDINKKEDRWAIDNGRALYSMGIFNVAPEMSWSIKGYGTFRRIFENLRLIPDSARDEAALNREEPELEKYAIRDLQDIHKKLGLAISFELFIQRARACGEIKSIIRSIDPDAGPYNPDNRAQEKLKDIHWPDRSKPLPFHKCLIATARKIGRYAIDNLPGKQRAKRLGAAAARLERR